MSGYIDADALITDLNKGLWGKDWDKVLAEAIINEAPSIDIVHCVECQYKGMEICPMYKLTKAGVLKPYDFCSYGERSSK